MTREEAINKVRQMSLPKETMDILEALAPELTMSEDEMMIYELQGFLRSFGSDYFGTGEWQKFDDWLEKQKEPLTAEEKMNHPLYLEGFDVGKKVGEVVSEQKPAEWNEDYNEENIQTRFAFYTYKDEPSTLYLSNVFVEESSRNHGFGTRILKAAEKVAEAIGAITISLKVKQNSPANAWYRKSGYGYVSFEDGYDWLEKNLEYMKPNKQEWSDEDADMLNCCISSIEEAKENRYAYKETDGDTSYDREIDWLKSLRPQQKVEWSEEDEENISTN